MCDLLNGSEFYGEETSESPGIVAEANRGEALCLIDRNDSISVNGLIGIARGETTVSYCGGRADVVTMNHGGADYHGEPDVRCRDHEHAGCGGATFGIRDDHDLLMNAIDGDAPRLNCDAEQNGERDEDDQRRSIARSIHSILCGSDEEDDEQCEDREDN